MDLEWLKGPVGGTLLIAAFGGIWKLVKKLLQLRSEHAALMLTAEDHREGRNLGEAKAAFEFLQQALRDANERIRSLTQQLLEEEAHSDHLQTSQIKLRIEMQTEILRVELRAKTAEQEVERLLIVKQELEDRYARETADRERAYKRWSHDLAECRKERDALKDRQ